MSSLCNVHYLSDIPRGFQCSNQHIPILTGASDTDMRLGCWQLVIIIYHDCRDAIVSAASFWH